MVADGGGGVQRCSAGWRRTARPGQRQTEKGTAAARTARKRPAAALQQQPRLPIYGCRWGGRGAGVFGGLAANCQTRAATDRKGDSSCTHCQKKAAAALQQQPRLPIYGCRWGGRGAEVFGGLAANCQTRAATDRKGDSSCTHCQKKAAAALQQQPRLPIYGCRWGGRGAEVFGGLAANCQTRAATDRTGDSSCTHCQKKAAAALQQQPRLPIYGCRWGGRGAEVFGGLAADCQTRAATDRKGDSSCTHCQKKAAAALQQQPRLPIYGCRWGGRGAEVFGGLAANCQTRAATDRTGEQQLHALPEKGSCSLATAA